MPEPEPGRCPNDHSVLQERLIFTGDLSLTVLRSCGILGCEFSELLHYRRPVDDPVGFLGELIEGKGA